MAHQPNKRRRSNYSTGYPDDLETVTGAGSWAGRVIDGGTLAQQAATGYGSQSTTWPRPDEYDVLYDLHEYARQTKTLDSYDTTQPDLVNSTTSSVTVPASSHLRPDMPAFTPQQSSSQSYLPPGYNVALPPFSTESSFNPLTNVWQTITTFVDLTTLDSTWWQDTTLPAYPQHDLPPPLDSSNFDLPPDFAHTWNHHQSWLQPQYPALTPPPSSQRALSLPPASMQHISRTLGQLPTPASTDRMIGEVHTVDDPNRVTGQFPRPFLPETPTPSGPWRAPTSQSGSHSCTHNEGTKCCNKTFDTQAELKKHQQSHRSAEDRPFKCYDCDANFNYQKDLDRHYDTKYHRRLAQDKHVRHFLCPAQTCSRHQTGFTRKDNFRRHLQAMHSDLGDAEPIIVWTSPPPSASGSLQSTT